MCLMDNLAQPCDAACGHPSKLLSFQALEKLLNQQPQAEASQITTFSVYREIDESEACAKLLLHSQSELSRLVSLLELEVETLKAPKRVSKTISATQVVESLCGRNASFTHVSRIISSFPSVIYRYKPFRIVLEVTYCSGEVSPALPSSGFRIMPYSTKLPLTPIDGPVLTYDEAIVTQVAHRWKVDIGNIKFMCTTKSCEFKNVCLVITHESVRMRPVVIEGIVVRARRKQKDPR